MKTQEVINQMKLIQSLNLKAGTIGSASLQRKNLCDVELEIHELSDKLDALKDEILTLFLSFCLMNKRLLDYTEQRCQIENEWDNFNTTEGRLSKNSKK